MAILLEISSGNYDQDIGKVRLAMNKISALCRLGGSFEISEPENRLGWTFFKILIQEDLFSGINVKFNDMIIKYAGKKDTEKFQKFMTDYFEHSGCKLNIKLIEV